MKKLGNKIYFIFLLLLMIIITALTFQLSIGEEDVDQDGISNSNDLCMYFSGSILNKGCPILDTPCVKNSEINTCTKGMVCGNEGYCKPEIPKKLTKTCIYPKNGSSIFGNAICESCPCEYRLDFLADMRKCDLILPAITSTGETQIYGRGKPYQLPYDYGKKK